ncbi:MAG TPA: hypothetical protein VFI34_07620 [Candidatus Limnocylindrales bacterium]|nr:hypothetical protein [Candidatus Limnocylindrales bacterium]
MSLIAPDDVEALMATGIAPAALQKVIDREEDWLANDPRVGIGQLVGERTQTVWVQILERRDLLIQRPTDEHGGAGSGGSLVVVDNGVELTSDEFALVGPARITHLWAGFPNGPWNGPKVEITYTPTDQVRVEETILELVRLRLSASPYNQEASEGHSYTRPKDLQAMREDLARSLHPHRGPMSTRLGHG